MKTEFVVAVSCKVFQSLTRLDLDAVQVRKFPSTSELVKVSAHGEHVEPLNLERRNGRRT